ncbi:MAG: hypothetical protein AAB650_00305 [Patescibacteria group bacterium]
MAKGLCDYQFSYQLADRFHLQPFTTPHDEEVDHNAKAEDEPSQAS